MHDNGPTSSAEIKVMERVTFVQEMKIKWQREREEKHTLNFKTIKWGRGWHQQISISSSNETWHTHTHKKVKTKHNEPFIFRYKEKKCRIFLKYNGFVVTIRIFANKFMTIAVMLQPHDEVEWKKKQMKEQVKNTGISINNRSIASGGEWCWCDFIDGLMWQILIFLLVLSEFNRALLGVLIKWWFDLCKFWKRCK